MTTAISNYQKILNYISFIEQNPNKTVKYFTFDNGKKFIIDGNKLKLLPLVYGTHCSKDEFWVHVNPSDKQVMFYSYDIEDYSTGRHIREEQGFFEWDKVEDSIYNFIVLNIEELATSPMPHSKIVDPKASYSGTPPVHSNSHTNTYVPPVYNNNGFNHYGSPAYKAREAFFDKIIALLKENHTSSAMDFISDTIDGMCKEKRFEELDTWLRMINFDKLNVPTMLGILRTTRGADHVLRERKEFFDKVKNYITRIKPARALVILKDLEPGKEYKDVVRYEK
jgi:hypothetical protein